jgi:hypothetical protein
VGTHGIRHRSATDIANSGIPVKVGMALTAHKTVVMFMRYVHTEDKPVREAAELVANRRKTITGAGHQGGGMTRRKASVRASSAAALLGDIRALIEASRQRVASAVNAELTCCSGASASASIRKCLPGSGPGTATKSCRPWRRSW